MEHAPSGLHVNQKDAANPSPYQLQFSERAVSLPPEAVLPVPLSQLW